MKLFIFIEILPETLKKSWKNMKRCLYRKKKILKTRKTENQDVRKYAECTLQLDLDIVDENCDEQLCEES